MTSNKPMQKVASFLISSLAVATSICISSDANAFGFYSYASSSGATVNSGGTLIPGSRGDDQVTTVTVPFNFSLYGSPVSSGQTITVSTNGNIQFLSSGGKNAPGNNALPSATFGNVRVIMPYWDDLDTSLPSAGIFSATSGSVGSQRWDLIWLGDPCCGTTNNTQFQVSFFEGSNNFEIDYAQTGAGSNGGSATVGDQSGNTAAAFSTQYSFNQAVITPGLRLFASAAVPFEFSPTLGLTLLGGFWLGSRAIKKIKSIKTV